MANEMEIDHKLLQRYIPCQTLPAAHLNDISGEGGKVHQKEQ